jgi:hypothetical protein
LKQSYNEIHRLYTSLIAMRNTYPVIEQIQIHLRDRSALITDTDGIVYIRDGHLNQLYGKLYENGGKLSWVKDLPRPRKPEESSLALSYPLPGGRKDVYGTLLVHLHPEKLKAMTEELKTDQEGLAFLLGETGNSVLGSAYVSIHQQPLFESLRMKVMSHDETSDSFVHRFEKIDYSVSFRRLDRLGSSWTYVTAMPLTKVTAPVVTVSRLLLGISALTLVSAFLMSWIASARLARPIRHLTRVFGGPSPLGGEDEFSFIRNRWDQVNSESHSVRQKLEQSMPMLKEGFLLQMVQGHYY